MRALLLPLLLAPSLTAQHTLFWSNRQLTAVPAATHDAEVLVRALLAGPPAPHFTSALPPGTSLHRIAVDGNRVVVVLGSRLLVARALGTFEDALEQVTKTLNSAGFAHVDIRIRTNAGEQSLAEALGELTEPTPARPRTPTFEPGAVPGALTGKTIAISPGHGFYWHSTLGWTTQRGNVNSMIEDFSNALLAIDYVIPYLVNAGAQVVCARERSFNTQEFFADNGDTTYTSSGTWTNSTNVTGFYGTNYRWATTALTETAVSRWIIDITAEGRYPLYVRYTAAGDRAADAKFRVIHAGGTSTVNVNQTQQGGRWLYLGEWEFNGASDAIIELSNQSASAGQVVVADAVRVGGGTGQSGGL